MKTFTPLKIALAQLTASPSVDENTAIAALTFTVGEIDPANSSRVQLLPDGHFKAKDGRPWEVPNNQWLMDNLAFELIKDDAAKRENPFHFDYEHQTLHAEYNGQPAPASGWFKEFDYVPGEGLFAINVDWTPKAGQHIKDKEYRFVSAVFHYDRETGRVLQILHAALTNDPALDGMKAVEALSAKKHLTTHNNPTGESPMPELLKTLLGKLGIEVNDDFNMSDAAALKKVEDDVTTALAALTTKADRAGTLEKDLNTANQTVAALKAQSAEPDATKFVPIDNYNALNTELAALKAGKDEESVEQLLEKNADKITGQADRAYLESVGKTQGAAALKAMLEPRTPIAGLTNKQTQTNTPQGGGKTLSDAQIAICKATGISEAEFLKQLDEQGE
ncbi:hypothetical protein tloyanaT_26200 [Thalassotalea loyana]|uniref:Phage scaffold protein n=1 Tax=Thalassotalea loyana TaxID=280483 RepID=A0ABQ6HE05_9GAMM|nr:phage protease [Thalassotalea loyana]GLX86367.1 hypothetical protein tloyanaT_26200 [Thalassotalea loyana]